MIIMFLLAIQMGHDVYAAAASLVITLGDAPNIEVSPEHFGSATQTVAITTDNYTGYSVSLSNPTASTDLVNADDSTLVIPTISPTGSSVTVSDFGNGYGVSLDGVNYVAAPTSESPLPIGGRNSAGSDTYTLEFGANPSATTAPGSYRKSFTVVAIVHNPQFSVAFHPNTTDQVTDMPADISTTTSTTGIVTLPETSPTRTSYSFLGWDTNASATTPIYPAGATNTITLEPTTANEIELYAIWEFIPEPVIADYTETFTNTTGPTASATTDLTGGTGTGLTPSEYVTKIFAYTNNTGRTISSITVEIVYSKSNQGSTSGYLVGKLNINGTEQTASPVSVARNKVTNEHLVLAQFNNLNIPSSSNVSFTIGTDSDSFTAGITISSQTVTVTFAD